MAFNRNYSVAIIDDEAELGEILCTMLEDEFTVEAYQSGEDAFVAWRKNGLPDIAITDLTMPRMSGRKIIHYCRQNFPDLKILIMSGYEDDHPAVKDAVAAGALGKISKPFKDPNGLPDLIRSYIDAESGFGN